MSKSLTQDYNLAKRKLETLFIEYKFDKRLELALEKSSKLRLPEIRYKFIELFSVVSLTDPKKLLANFNYFKKEASLFDINTKKLIDDLSRRLLENKDRLESQNRLLESKDRLLESQNRLLESKDEELKILKQPKEKKKIKIIESFITVQFLLYIFDFFIPEKYNNVITHFMLKSENFKIIVDYFIDTQNTIEMLKKSLDIETRICLFIIALIFILLLVRYFQMFNLEIVGPFGKHTLKFKSKTKSKTKSKSKTKTKSKSKIKSKKSL
jgi:hypothetical protein